MKSVNVCVMDGQALFQISSMSNATHEKVTAAVRGAKLSEVTDNRPNYAFSVAAVNLENVAPALQAITTLITVEKIGAENKKGDRQSFVREEGAALMNAARFALAR